MGGLGVVVYEVHKQGAPRALEARAVGGVEDRSGPAVEAVVVGVLVAVLNVDAALVELAAGDEHELGRLRVTERGA